MSSSHTKHFCPKQQKIRMVLWATVPSESLPCKILTISTISPQEPATAKKTFSSAHEPTVWRTIPVLKFLLQSWENMAGLPKISDVEDAIRKGLENINKWYRKVNDTDTFFICLGMFIFLLDFIYPHDTLSPSLSLGPNYQDRLCQREMAGSVEQAYRQYSGPT